MRTLITLLITIITVNLTEETFSRAVSQSEFLGAEGVAGFRLFGMKVGETFTRNVFLIEAEKKGGAALSGLVNALALSLFSRCCSLPIHHSDLGVQACRY